MKELVKQLNEQQVKAEDYKEKLLKVMDNTADGLDELRFERWSRKILRSIKRN